MKKFLSVLFILSLAVCMVACGEKNLPLENEIVLEQQPVKKYFDESLLEHYAETQVISLPENPTTGYEWIFFIDDAEVVTSVSDNFEAPTNTDGLVGVGGNRVCEFKGLKEGDTTIEFHYIRGLEENEEPVEIVKFNVSVNSNNEIAIMNEVH